MTSRAVPIGAALILAILATGGCKKDDGESEPLRDWRPEAALMDLDFCREALVAAGWKVKSEPTEMKLPASALRSAGHRPAGDTSAVSQTFEKGDRSANVTITKYPGDVDPPEGDRGISLGAVMLLAGSRSVMVSVMDADWEDLPDEAEVVLTTIIAAAEAQLAKAK